MGLVKLNLAFQLRLLCALHKCAVVGISTSKAEAMVFKQNEFLIQLKDGGKVRDFS